MKILYVATKYDYGNPERGLSFEHWNFFHSLSEIGHEILYFDFMSLYQEQGRTIMNRRLQEVATSESPDLLFTFLARDELDKSVIQYISHETDTLTLNWFADDHWRFDNFSRYWAPCFNWVVTTAASALPKYDALSYQNVIKSQWGLNPFLYRNLNLDYQYDVTFIGQPHGNRRMIIECLRDAGISVKAWGYGWESGRLSQQEMIKVMNQSRINLNLSNASATNWRKGAPSLVTKTRRLIGRSLDQFDVGRRVKVWRRERSVGRADTVIYPEQIKARNFEIPGCGSFQCTGPAENIDEYFDERQEILIFHDVDELIEMIQYYLNHDEERQSIADAGYKRALRDHTYQRRFEEIFKIMGISG